MGLGEASADHRWWALARSEEVTARKPLAVDIGDQPVVLWRDTAGIARALEDRCPHRRAPLSLGCIRPEGWIQCGYHGWSYDGETGRLREIPNMKGDQRFPPVYRAAAFAVHEAAGFVRVCLNAKAVPPTDANPAMRLAGTAHVALAHEQYVAAMFDDPGLLLRVRGVAFTPYLMSELREERGRLTMERSCQWSGPRWPAPFSSDFPATLLTRTDPVTGATDMMLRDARFRELLRATIAPVPAARGTTSVRWRAEVMRTPAGARKLLAFGPPLRVFDTIDANRLRTLKPSASLHGETLRAKLTHPVHSLPAPAKGPQNA